jgi:hypothetical protein
MTMIIDGTNGLTFNNASTQASAGLTAASPTISSGSLTFADATTMTSGQQAAKAWIQFSSGTINASYNVSSLTTNGSGDYTVNFTNAFADNKYAFVGASGIASSFSVIGTAGYTPSTTSCRVLNQNLSGSNTAPLFASVAFFR